MNHPPVNFQWTLKNKNETRSPKNPMILARALSEKISFVAFWNSFVKRIAGIRMIAQKTDSAIKRNDGVININLLLRMRGKAAF